MEKLLQVKLEPKVSDEADLKLFEVCKNRIIRFLQNCRTTEKRNVELTNNFTAPKTNLNNYGLIDYEEFGVLIFKQFPKFSDNAILSVRVLYLLEDSKTTE